MRKSKRDLGRSNGVPKMMRKRIILLTCRDRLV